MSMAVAVTGISIPIGLSFVLMRLTNATPLQCFTAGASLSSTSLGTTFTVLGTSGLTRSRLGVILTTAAMMDDVVGLVLVQIISNLGKEGASITSSIVIRPLLVSGFRCLEAFAMPLSRAAPDEADQSSPQTIGSRRVQSFLGVGAPATASGASVSWWDSTGSDKGESSAANASADRNIVHPSVDEGNKGNQTPSAKATGPQTIKEDSATSGMQVYEIYFLTPVDRILKPFFFASIGFSIPITKMFSGDIVWKRFVYAMLMILAKLACGIWLTSVSLTCAADNSSRTGSPVKTQAEDAGENYNGNGTATSNGQGGRDATTQATPKYRSLYPASIIGCAMVARGEIGFLISSMAESNNISLPFLEEVAPLTYS
ncbi:hypothetical protein E4U60_000928 [Claviceps pazoutovae]|uniref:Cation/H+ exchanger transmembrane domain-containing protein n=1 Tax=Claviceps pazoutovae TaxID=1649127 RepID=A0A9P7MDZ7_9HYPO|nr:hypothetical protein E4U60_000928 [Claviceps pazoutovae]